MGLLSGLTLQKSRLRKASPDCSSIKEIHQAGLCLPLTPDDRFPHYQSVSVCTDRGIQAPVTGFNVEQPVVFPS